MTDRATSLEAGTPAANHFGIGIVLAVASFLIYATIIFSQPQVSDNTYPCERSSVAAAITNVVYGKPVGTVYKGVLDRFLETFNTPLAQVLRGTREASAPLPLPSGELLKTTEDGNGVGYPIVATAAFRLFGVNAWALSLAMLMLMALTAALFVWRFPELACVVTLYFVALTVMLFTRLGWDPVYAVQIPVAGIRYFSLVTILPAFHILLDILAKPAIEPRMARWYDVMLAIQVAILVLAILVRGSAMTLIAAVAVVALIGGWRHRQDRNWLRPLRRKSIVMGLTAMGLVAAVALAVPANYVKKGRFGTVIWDRIIESLGANPAFPWPGVREMFANCEKYIPEGIEPGMPDRNGHCIWFTYVIEHKIPINSIAHETYGGRFEIAMRDAFFQIARRYPKEVVTTFLYYKPLMIYSSINASLVFRFGAYSPAGIGLLMASLAVLLANVIIAPLPLSQFARVAGVTVLCAGCAIPPLIAVWAMPHTSADLLFFCIFLAGLVLSAIPLGVEVALQRMRLASVKHI
jgi:hypothetical protein